MRATPSGTRIDGVPAVNEVAVRDGVVCCGRVSTGVDAPLVALLIPASIQSVKAQDADAARVWSAVTREAFEEYFGRGYVVTDLVRRDAHVSAYVLERDYRG